MALASACVSEPPDRVYGLPAVHIYADSQSLARLRAGTFSKTGAPVFVHLGGRDRAAVLSVAGESSVDDVKTSLSIDLRSPWRGRTRYRLNGMSRDPSATRSMLAWPVFAAPDTPVPEVDHVAVFVDDDYLGLYLLHATIDRDFVAGAGDEAVSIYGARRTNATMRSTADIESAFSSRTGDDYSDLLLLIELLHDPSPAGRDRLDALLDWRSVIDYMAAVHYVNHQDGVDNNFILVRTRDHPRFRVWPWDLDFTFRTVADPTDGGVFARNAMMEQAFADPDKRRLFTCALARLARDVPASALNRDVDALAADIAEAHARDPVLGAGRPLPDQVADIRERNLALQARLNASPPECP